METSNILSQYELPKTHREILKPNADIVQFQFQDSCKGMLFLFNVVKHSKGGYSFENVVILFFLSTPNTRQPFH